MKQASNTLESVPGKNDRVRVMVVDDDRDLADSLRDVLELEDDTLDVRVVYSADAAISLADEFKPDISLLDIKLGRTSGLDLVPKLKRSIPDTVCVMMTAFRDTEYAVTAVKFGADEYLHKPVDPAILLQALNRFKQQKQLINEKRASERRFRAVFNQTFQMLFILGTDGTLIDANDVAIEFMNVDKQEIVGKHLTALPRIGRQSDVSDKMCAGVERAAVGSTERMLCRFTGEVEEVEYDCSIKPVLDAIGKVEYVVMEAHDISQLKQAEREVRRINADLERRVLERTIEMRSALEKAEYASEAKSRFLSRMSHELRTPMNAILGFTQLLDIDSDPPLVGHQREYVDEMLESGQHLLDLIAGVLDLTRLESGEFIVDLKPVSLGSAITDAVRMVDGMVQDKHIKLVQPEDLSEVMVLSDSHRLRQVLYNLLNNAIKYSVEGGKVVVQLQALSGNGFKLTVSDSGEGISENDMAGIFQPFAVLGDENFSDGIGIGLTLVKQLMEQMGGEVGVESKPGVGSSFWITLNKADLQAEPAAPAMAADNVVPLVHPQFKILYVPGETSALQPLRSIVANRKDISILSASDQREALFLAQSNAPDLVLLDIDLSASDINHFKQKLSLESALSHIPVAALSGSVSKEHELKARENGIQSLLSHSWAEKQFFGALCELLPSL